MVSLRVVSVISFVASYLLVSREPGWSTWQLLFTFVSTCAFQLFCWALYSFILYPKYFSPLRDLPSPSDNHWLFGQFGRIRREPTGIPQREWLSTIPNDGIIRYLGLFNHERLMLTSSKALAEVLVTRSYEYVKPPEVQLSLSRILGVGVLVAEGDEHKFQRKKLMPAFAFRHIKDLYPVFWEKSREAVRAMTNDITANASFNKQTSTLPDPEKASKTKVIEVGDWASRATLDIIGVAGLGKDFGAIENPDTELNHIYKSVFTPSQQARRLALLTFFLPQWFVSRLPVKRNNDIVAASQTIRSVCGDLIREKREQIARQEKGKEEPTGVDILSVALGSGAFTDENLIDQLMTFLAAGHETTATAMTWGIYLLAKNPAIQARLRQEVRAHLPSIDDDREISSADIDNFTYLNAVCSEILRYYAPVPLTLRQAGPGAMLLGRPVPEGTRIILSPWATNFDPKLWGADAAEFRPERWISSSSPSTTEDGSGNKQQDHFLASGGASSNFAYLTFLHGPRSCIGQSFAKAEFACLLACWVGRFEFALKDEADRDENNISIKGSGATAKPEHGMYVDATVVDGW